MTAFPIPTELRLADTVLLWPFRGLFFAPVPIPIPIPIIALIMFPVAFTTPRAVAAVVPAAVAAAADTTAATVLGE